MGQGYIPDTNIVIYYLEGVLTPAGKTSVVKAIVGGAKTSPTYHQKKLKIIDPFKL